MIFTASFFALYQLAKALALIVFSWSASGSAVRVATGLVSHTLCSETFVAGLDPDQRAELLVLLAQVADSSGIFEGCVERLAL